ncbi:MAG TPA: polysaccharide biosynthesis/export family protein [Pyrinomonadaceae bacterium]|nr:polysaccharide biosynthesis/export family protein [Pyrinomonadaceae bacterium]
MRASYLRVLAITIGLLVFSSAPLLVEAQTPTGQPQPSESPGQVGPKSGSPSILISPDSDYQIGARDVVEIQIEKAPELSGTFSVSAAGSILMPYLGRVPALRKTPEQLSKLIEDGLRGGYLRNPLVRVVVKQYNSRSFFIQGAVRSPGVYQIDGSASLLKLIILAGGLGENHGSTAFIIREIKPAVDESDGTAQPPSRATATASPANGKAAQAEPVAAVPEEEKYELVKANINGMLTGQFEQNIRIEPGDIVNIPPNDVFFVAGEVQAPGSFRLKDGTTLRQAISLAQGMTFRSASDRGVIFREDVASGKRQEIKVDVGAIMSGKNEDIAIMANDVIIIPNSKFKSVGATLLSAFGVSAMGRLPIPR